MLDNVPMEMSTPTARAIWSLAQEYVRGVSSKDICGVIAVFHGEVPWVDDEDSWSWQLASEDMDLSPYYWGVNA